MRTEMEEGYIKFNCKWTESELDSEEGISEINFAREKLYALGWIGVLPDGIGFGNISLRRNGNEFLITGTQTGAIEKLDRRHFSLVTNYSVKENSITCIGPLKASSESLTHAMIYECSPETKAVIHIHNSEMWNKLLNKAPTTNANAEYGTPEIANEIRRLFSDSRVKQEKIIVLGGHQDGILAFGKNIKEALNVILQNNSDKF